MARQPYFTTAPDDAPLPANRVAPLLVSLFLFLLAFFILLNSVAQQENRRLSSAVKSLQETFNKDDTSVAAPVLKSTKSSAAKGEVSQGLFTKTRAAAETSFALVEVREQDNGNQLELTFITEAFFGEKNATLRESVNQFLVGLADTVSFQHLGTRVEMELVFAEIPPSRDPDAQGQFLPRNNLSMARAGVLARALESLGIERSALHLGLQEGAPLSRFHIIFRIHDQVPATFQRQENSPSEKPDLKQLPKELPERGGDAQG